MSCSDLGQRDDICTGPASFGRAVCCEYTLVIRRHFTLTDIQHELHAVVGGEVENCLHILRIIKNLKRNCIYISLSIGWAHWASGRCSLGQWAWPIWNEVGVVLKHSRYGHSLHFTPILCTALHCLNCDLIIGLSTFTEYNI